jgi:hypothetical protein
MSERRRCEAKPEDSRNDATVYAFHNPAPCSLLSILGDAATTTSRQSEDDSNYSHRHMV